MAKLRTVNTRFWDDSYVINLDPIEKLLFLYLLTNPLTNIAGIYEVSLRRVSFDTGIEKDMVQKILKRFEKEKKVFYKAGWVGIVNFVKNQSMNPKVVRGIEIELAKAPKAMRELIPVSIDSLSIGFDSPSQSKSNPKSKYKSNPNAGSGSLKKDEAESVGTILNRNYR